MKRNRLRAALLVSGEETRASPGNPAGVTTVTRPLLLAALGFAVFVLVYPQVRDRLPHSLTYHRSASSAAAAAQSSSQLSTEEYGQIDSSFSPERLGSFAGEPATKTKASVEGVQLECWYYGVAGARGAYQICFENGHLSTKSRFGQ
jgi:hypothetical protein